MDEYDVLVVGGGPAGSSVAWGLRDSGLAVALMDKSAFPRNKVCAGWITPAVVDALHLDTDEYAGPRVFQPIRGFRLALMGRREVEIDYGETPVSYGIRRCEFDHYLLRRSGARLLLGEPFKTMRAGDGGWVVNGHIRARLVVGAGGHYCPVARTLGAKLGKAETIVAAQEVEFEMTPAQQAACPVRGEIPELFFCDDLRGYGWVFRKGNYLNVGLGREDNRGLGDCVAAFTATLKRQGRIPGDTPQRFNGHAYLLYRHTRRSWLGDGVMLVGDAAGLAYPQSGEGIRPAIESGLLAAATIGAAAGDYRRDRLGKYSHALAERLGSGAGPSLADRLPVGLRHGLARGLLSTHWFNRHVVMDRWFLHRRQRPLACRT